MRDIVSALLGFKEKLLLSSEQSRTMHSSLGSWMDESVERLAQFLQILLSSGLLAMKQGTVLYYIRRCFAMSKLITSKDIATWVIQCTLRV